MKMIFPHRSRNTKSLGAAAPLLLWAFTMTASPVQAGQDTPAPASAPTKTASGRATRPETLKQITMRVGETTGLRVLADSALAGQRLVAPEDEAVTPATVEDYLTRLTRRLPPGAAWYKVYLPASAGDRPFTADAVAQLAQAQRALLGRSAANMVEIQGKVLTVAEAAPLIQTLGLTPVYVLAGKPGTTAANLAAAGGLWTGGDTSALMGALTKQLGVANIKAIPPGSYKISLPGPDGSPREATVEVSGTEESRRIAIKMGTPAP